MKRITVLLAEDHNVVREGLRALLDIDGTIEVVAEAQTGRQAVELARKLVPAVVLMDIGMPELNGLEATRQILMENPGIRILILSAHDDTAYVEKAIAVGASGYILKQSSAKNLAGAIHDIAKGKTVYSPSIAKRLRHSKQKAPGHTGILKKVNAELTPREAETLQLVAEGKANKQIAAELAISIKTVEKHRQHLMKKLDVHDTAGLTRYAMNHGIIEGCGDALHE